MAKPFRFRQHRGERALDQRQLECVLVRSARAGEQLRASTALAPRGISRFGRLDPPRLVRNTPERDAAGAVALHDGSDRNQREGKRSAVAYLAIDLRAADRLGQRHCGDQLARLSVVSMCGVSPGSRWKSAIGIVRVEPSGRTVSTVASSARIATAMSLGWVAMHASLTPTTACWRLKPPIAEQPLPGWRLLQGWLVS